MKVLRYLLIPLMLSGVLVACQTEKSDKSTTESAKWKNQFESQLSEFGHRNWILIVDKAYPSQNSPGVVTIDTHEDLLKVLNFALTKVDSSTHVKPIIYTDKELNFITPQQVPGIDEYRTNLKKMIGSYQPQVMLHDSVFVKMDQASKLFKVLVLKTNQVIPYSSVFMQLDCKYWTTEKEKQLRAAMQASQKN